MDIGHDDDDDDDVSLSLWRVRTHTIAGLLNATFVGTDFVFVERKQSNA